MRKNIAMVGADGSASNRLMTGGTAYGADRPHRPWRWRRGGADVRLGDVRGDAINRAVLPRAAADHDCGAWLESLGRAVGVADCGDAFGLYLRPLFLRRLPGGARHS